MWMRVDALREVGSLTRPILPIGLVVVRGGYSDGSWASNSLWILTSRYVGRGSGVYGGGGVDNERAELELDVPLVEDGESDFG